LTVSKRQHEVGQPEDRAAEVLSVADPAYPVLLVCDHASNFIPPSLTDLGVAEELLPSHIAWDIGAATITRTLARRLNVPAVLCQYSRLVVDCNRNLDDVSAFPEVSDGIAIPGNAALSAQDREARANQVYWPYHHAVRDQLRLLENFAPAPALVAIHSFTPAMAGKIRPWHVGVLWDKDDRISRPLLQRMRDDGDVEVGDNEPYSGKHPADFTLDHHAEAEGLPHVGIEIRQDLANTPDTAKRVGELLALVLVDIFKDQNLYTLRAGSA
jgi:predicted N-formylglutamate amidohydrolase